MLHFRLNDDYQAGKHQLYIFKSNIDSSRQIIDPGSWNTREFFIWMEGQVKQESSAEYNFTTPFIQDSLMEAFYWQMLNLVPLENLSDEFTETTRRTAFQSKLLRLFESRKNMNLTVDQMAEQLFMSRRNLSLLCDKYILESPAKAFFAVPSGECSCRSS